jgi:hypothetical protein
LRSVELQDRSGSGEVAIEGRPTYTEVLGDVLAGVTVGLHPLGGGDVFRVFDLVGTTETGVVGLTIEPPGRNTVREQDPAGSLRDGNKPTIGCPAHQPGPNEPALIRFDWRLNIVAGVWNPLRAY